MPVVIDPKQVPRREPTHTVTPIASLDELIDTVAKVIERVDDVMDIERILDGIARFHSERPKDFDKRVAALRKRVQGHEEWHFDTVLAGAARVGVSQLVCQWLDLPPIERHDGGWRDFSGAFLRKRVQEVGGRFGKKAAPLLALPTYRDGWLEPVALVERFAAYRWSGGGYGVDHFDLAQALLRLTPDGRDEAGKLARKMSGRGLEPLYFALGESNKLPDREGGGYGADQICLAAIRARSLVDELADLDLPFTVPTARLEENGSMRFSGPIADDPAKPGDFPLLAHSTLAIDRSQQPWGRTPQNADWIVQWQNTVAPGDRRMLCLYGSLGASPAHLHNLFDRDTTWHDEQARLAALATGTEIPVSKGLVTDALIEAFGACNVDPAMLGRHLAEVVARLKLNRVASVFAEVARVSSLHQWAVFAALATFVGRLVAAPRDLHHILTVLLETATVTGKTLGEEASALLRAVKGSSKTGKLAKQLLALEHGPQRMQSVRAQALAACVDRARRWSRH